MSVNVFLTRLEESGSAACEIHTQVFVEMCHNTTSLCVGMFARHIQSELRRVEASVTGVIAQEWRWRRRVCGRGNACVFLGRVGRGVICER